MDKTYYLGKEYSIKTVSYPGKEARILFKEDCFYIYTNPRWNIKQHQAETLEALRRWYIKEAETLINQRVRHYAEVIGEDYNGVRIKEQRTRWGSCSSNRNLNFNWKLIMAPMNILDYVVIHELCHLKQMNHSKEFWQTVATYFADYKEAKQWLKENGGKLTIG